MSPDISERAFEEASEAALLRNGPDALVAFSETVQDGGQSYTESGMNSAGEQEVIGEAKTAMRFDRHVHRPADPDDSGQDCLRGQLPAEPGARVPEMEGDRIRGR